MGGKSPGIWITEVAPMKNLVWGLLSLFPGATEPDKYAHSTNEV